MPAKSKADRESLAQYRLEHDRCAVCYHRGAGWNPLEIHHLAHRNGKDQHDHRALILLCRECHQGYHSGGGKSLSLGQLLTAKEEEDGTLDIPFLAGLKGRKWLKDDPQPLPLWAEDHRRDNRR
jgi:hypothetical protein